MVRAHKAGGSGSRCRGRFLAPSLLADSGYIQPFLSPVPSVSPPIRIESSSPTVVEGQTLDLNCVVAGQPQAIITWYKRGGSLPARHQVQSGNGVGGTLASWGVYKNSPVGKEPEALAGNPGAVLPPALGRQRVASERLTREAWEEA